MKCPMCGTETDKLYVFEPVHLVGILTEGGEQPPEVFQMPDELEREYTCPNCLETVTEDEREAYELMGTPFEKLWTWAYRGGEINGTVRATNWEDAIDRVIKLHPDLHSDMFEVELGDNEDSDIQ